MLLQRILRDNGRSSGAITGILTAVTYGGSGLLTIIRADSVVTYSYGRLILLFDGKGVGLRLVCGRIRNVCSNIANSVGAAVSFFFRRILLAR